MTQYQHFTNIEMRRKELYGSHELKISDSRRVLFSGPPINTHKGPRKQVMDKDTGDIYESALEAAENIGISEQYVHQQCKHNNGRFIYTGQKTNVAKSNKQLVPVRCVKTGKIYRSITLACLETGQHYNTIWNNISGKTKNPSWELA